MLGSDQQVSKVCSDTGRTFRVKVLYVKHLLQSTDENEADDTSNYQNWRKAVQILEEMERNDKFNLGESILCSCEVRIRLYQDSNVGKGEAALAFLAAFKRFLEEEEEAEEKEHKELVDRIYRVKRTALMWKEFGASYPKESDDRELVISALLTRMATDEGLELAVLRIKCARLCHLLEVGEVRGLAILTSCLLEAQRFSDGIDTALGVMESGGSLDGDENWKMCQDVSRVLIASCSSSCGDTNSGLWPVLRTVSSRLASSCPSSAIVQCSRQSWWSRILADVAQHSSLRGRAADATVDPFNQWKLEPLYTEKSLPPDAKALGKLAKFVKRNIFENDNPCILAKEEMEFTSVVEHLQRHAATEITLRLKLLLKTEKRESKSDQGISEDIVTLLKKSLGDRRHDLRPVTAYLFLLCNSSMLEAFVRVANGLGSDQARLELLWALACRLCFLRGITEPASEMASMHTAAAWVRKATTEFGVDRDLSLSGGMPEKEAALVELMGKAPKFTVTDLKKFCKSFALPIVPAAMEYVKMSLTKLEPVVSSDGDKRAAAVSKPETFEAVVQNCLEAVTMMDEHMIESVATQLLSEVSPYNYEVLKLVVTMMDDIGHRMASKVSQILGFLTNYSRTSEPSEREREIWAETKVLPFPPIARHRLPLTWMITGLTPRDRFKVGKIIWHRSIGDISY